MIEINGKTKYKEAIKKVVEECLSMHNVAEEDVTLSINFVDDEEIAEINKSGRGVEGATDVLSFPGIEVKFPFKKEDYPTDTDPDTDEIMLGDIFISEERAKEQSESFNHSLKREVSFLAVHGTLHILGYDHINEEDEKKMMQVAEEILEKANVKREGNETEESECVRGANIPFKSGFAAVLGRPNAGKSTLINSLVGEKVSIVSWKPQTTRNRILGIMNGENYQVVFMDTPGLHAPKNSLGKFMMRSATAALESVEIVIYVLDAEKGVSEQDFKNLGKYQTEEKKVIIVINKTDRVTKEKVGEMLKILSPLNFVKAIVPVSALRERNIEPLKKELYALLEEGEMLYPEDMYTDKDMRFMASETIREKALRVLDKEIPHGVGVFINKYEVRENGIIDIDADIICQKASHKPIILGKKGDTIKTIGTYARQDLENITGSKVFLTLWVRVREDWRDNDGILKELGYTKDNY